MHREIVNRRIITNLASLVLLSATPLLLRLRPCFLRIIELLVAIERDSLLEACSVTYTLFDNKKW